MKEGFKKKKVLIVVALLLISSVLLFSNSPAFADKLADAIAATPQGTEKGMINPDAEKGFLGIPGAPDVNLLYGFLWAIWVGWIFSTVGAFGGIMAGVGHITIFGLGDYAKSFKQSNPTLNKMLTDSIRVSNQWLVGLSALISSINYYKMGRLVLPLGIALAVGSVTGSILVPIITAAYIGYFGLCVFVIGGFLFMKRQAKASQKRRTQRLRQRHLKKLISS